MRPEMGGQDAVGLAMIVAPHLWGVPVPEDI
jgi:predicted cobalt transporter CbtA